MIEIYLCLLLSQVELKFKAGEIIFVFGDMDDDGFFKVGNCGAQKIVFPKIIPSGNGGI